MFVGKMLAFHGDIPNIPAFLSADFRGWKTEV